MKRIFLASLGLLSPGTHALGMAAYQKEADCILALEDSADENSINPGIPFEVIKQGGPGLRKAIIEAAPEMARRIPPEGTQDLAREAARGDKGSRALLEYLRAVKADPKAPVPQAVVDMVVEGYEADVQRPRVIEKTPKILILEPNGVALESTPERAQLRFHSGFHNDKEFDASRTPVVRPDVTQKIDSYIQLRVVQVMSSLYGETRAKEVLGLTRVPPIAPISKVSEARVLAALKGCANALPRHAVLLKATAYVTNSSRKTQEKAGH